MLFTKEITSITFEDVVSFCKEQNPESINLDYKKDFPRDLEKTISAFANTMGGLIIIGVEDEDSKPKLPVTGLKYQEGYRERVNSIILGNIYPPVFPEIQVCPPIQNKTFVVIRVPQSNMTPHYIRHRTKAYVRTDDITHPETLATADRIEWLRDRRKKSEELKELLYASALERYNNNIKIEKIKGIQVCEATASIVPLYPTKPYKTPQEIKQISKDITARGYGEYFPDFFRTISIQGGIADFHYYERSQTIKYTEINHFGLIFHKEELGRVEDGVSGESYEESKYTYLYWMIRLVDLFLEASVNFYESLGYWGLVEFNFSLKKMLGVYVIFEERRKTKNISIDDELNWQKLYYVNAVRDRRPEIVIELLKDISWSLGLEHVTEEDIEAVLDKNNRLSEDKQKEE